MYPIPPMITSNATSDPPEDQNAGRNPTATQPSAIYTGTYSHRGAFSQNTRPSRPSNAPPQTTNNSHRAVVDGSNSVANGVYVPAITMKMFEWSKRRSTPATCGDQVPRWWMARVVNRTGEATATPAGV